MGEKVRLPKLDGRLVAILDDDPVDLYRLRAVFEMLGARVVGATNAIELMLKLDDQREPPSLLLLDAIAHASQKVSSLSLAQLIWSKYGRRAIPAAFMGETPFEDFLHEIVGNHLVLQKPVRLPWVEALASALLDERVFGFRKKVELAGAGVPWWLPAHAEAAR